jgi:hypothetical protein
VDDVVYGLTCVIMLYGFTCDRDGTRGVVCIEPVAGCEPDGAH